MSKSWRRDSTSSAPKADGRYWQEQQKRSKSDGVTGRRWIAPGLFLLSFVLLGWLVYKLLFLPRDLVVLPITVHYDAPIPVNGLADEDVKLFEDALQGNFKVEAQMVANARKFPNRDEFCTEFKARLGEIRPVGPTIWEKSVVLYLSAHGVVDKDGNPCLLMPKSEAHDCRNWLKVETLINIIQEHDNLQETNVALLLDCGRIRDCWPLGVFDNDFASQLRDVVNKIGGPRLYVVNAADTGETAWTAPELNGTVFGHFVAKGLVGVGHDSSRVTVQDLVTYLQSHVGEYTRRYRATSQRPFLVRRGDDTADCQLSFALHDPQIEVTPPNRSLLESRHDSVSELWKTYEKVSAKAAFRFQPLRFGKVANQLMRLEDLIPAGQAYQDQYDITLRVTKTELDDLAKASYATTNVASTAAVMARVQDYDDLYDADNVFMPKQDFVQWLSDRKDPEKEAQPPTFGRDATALAVWTWLSEQSQIRREDIQDAQTYLNLSEELDASEDEDPFLPSEVHFTRLLGAYLPWDLPWETQEWESIIPRALSIQRQAEELAAPEDIRAFYWSHRDLEQADQKLRVARDQLFVGTDDAIQTAGLLWDEVSGANGRASTLDRVRSVQQTVTRAYRVRDTAFALTPHFARWATANDRRRHLPTVNQLIAATQQLGKQLDLQGVSVDTKLIDDTEELLQRLQKEFESECEYCLGSGNQDVAQVVLRDIAELLTYPIPTRGADYHYMLRQKLLQQRWLAKPDLYLDAANSNTSAARQPERPATLRGSEHPAGRMLLPRNDDQSLAQLGGAVRDHLKAIQDAADSLATETDEQLATLEAVLSNARTARRSLSQADQQLRWAAAFLPKIETDFVRRLWRYDHHFFLVWHGWRALRDLWGPDPSATVSTPAFYSQAVARCLLEANELYQGGAQYQALLEYAASATTAALANWRPLLYDDVTLFDDPTAEGGLVEHRMRFQPLAAGKNLLQSQLMVNESAPAIFVEDSNRFFPWFDRNVAGPARTPMARRTSKTPQLRHAFDSVALKDDPNLQAVTLFRGHAIKSPLRIDTGIEAVVFQRPSPTPTTVVVVGDRGIKMQVVFVVDCSISMGVQKMRKAIDVLEDTLKQIEADHERFEIAFYVFGRKQGNANVLNAIEQLVPMGPAARNVPAVRAQLHGVRSFGRTPLYKSIAEASTAFRNVGPRHQKLMIVLTDGQNFVPLNPRNPVREEKIGVQHELDADANIANANCQVMIVGYAVTSGVRHGPEITTFADENRLVEYKNAANINQVKRNIVEAIGLSTFSVASPNTSPTKFLSFGQRWNTRAPYPKTYNVVVRDGPASPITLHGNEAIEMIYENQQLLHVRYRRNDPQKKTADHVVRFHTHGLDGDEIGISLQRLDRRFTPRPQRALMSIRPVGKSEMVFYGHELEFKPERPVPVMNYRLAGWPKDEARAQIELSYSMQVPIRTRKVTLDLTNNTLEQPFRRDVRLQLETTPARSDGLVRIAISEVHDATSKLFPLHLTLNPEPFSARHSLERRLPDGRREIKHVFAIEQDRIQNAEVSLQLITPLERQDTWVRVDPITLDVHHWTERR